MKKLILSVLLQEEVAERVLKKHDSVYQHMKYTFKLHRTPSNNN